MSSHLELPRTDAVRHPRRYLLESLRPAARWILRRRYDVVVHHPERVPATGPVVFAANHAGVIDGPLLANMTEFGKSPHLTVDEFAELGYRMVIFPMSAFRAMMKTVEELFRELREKGTLVGALDRMQTREELYRLLDYDAYTQMDVDLAARFPERHSP